MSVFAVLAELWDRMAGAQPAPPVWVVAASGVVALIGVANRRAWRLARNVITIAHEGGHALASLLSGRRLGGIRLHSDTSGETRSRGRPDGPGMVATALAGYVTPPLLGAGAAWLLAAHHVVALLWLLLLLLCATFLTMRNAYGVLAVLVTAAAVSAVTWLAGALVQSAFGYCAAWFLLLGGMRPVVELWRSRSRARRRGRAPSRVPGRGASDADQLARLTGVPGGVWVGFFWLVAAAALLLGAWLLIPASLHVPQIR
jgi:Peptidase M50B-like